MLSIRPWPRPPSIDVDRFMQVAVESRLISKDTLESVFHEFLGGMRAPDSRGSDLVAFCDYLVFRELLTRWQVNLLLQGRVNEFFFGNYRFLAVVRNDGRKESFLVRDENTNRRAILSFKLYRPATLKPSGK